MGWTMSSDRGWLIISIIIYLFSIFTTLQLITVQPSGRGFLRCASAVANGSFKPVKPHQSDHCQVPPPDQWMTVMMASTFFLNLGSKIPWRACSQQLQPMRPTSQLQLTNVWKIKRLCSKIWSFHFNSMHWYLFSHTKLILMLGFIFFGPFICWNRKCNSNMLTNVSTCANGLIFGLDKSEKKKSTHPSVD
jgi:hypothetical protein